jgi:hypothetical protein
VTTRYVYRTTITVTVDMGDDGDLYEGQPQTWAPGEQEASAREWAEQALPLIEAFGEDFVDVDAPALTLVETKAVQR